MVHIYKSLSFFIFFLAISHIIIAQNATWFTPADRGIRILGENIGRYDDIFFISKDTGVLVSSYGIIFKTYNGAFDWYIKKVATDGTYFRSVEFSSDGQVGIAGTLSGNVYRSADRGETWDDISSSVPDTGADARDICGLAHFGDIFYGVGWWGGTQPRFYTSLDGGIHWTVRYIDTSLASGLVDIAFLTPYKGFITGYRALPDRRESVVLRTMDGGLTWEKVFSDTTIGGRIWKIQFLDSLYGVGSIEPMYADTVAMIKTADGGSTWQLMPAGHVNGWTGLSAFGTQGIGFINRDTGWLGGYYNGMFQTMDGGLTWDTLSINQECDRFFVIDSMIYVSANTVYKYSSDTGMSTTPTQVSQPVYVHKLYPVHPNPSPGQIDIAFDINQHATNVVLEIANIDGKRSYPVARGRFAPGHYKYSWDGTSMPRGNYMIWLGTDEIPMAEKFTLK